MQQHDQLFTHTITNAGPADLDFITDVDWGLERFSVMCKSDVAIQVIGTRTLGATASSPIQLAKGESFTWSKANGIKPFTIRVPQNGIAIITAI